MQQQVKLDKYKTCNYTQSKQQTARTNDCSKVKLHGLVRSLNFISLGVDFLDPVNQQITDPLIQLSKHLTYKY